MVIGALVTPNGIYTSPLLQERYLSLPMAAHEMGNPQVRNRGTVGGNICNASPLADLPPLLIAFNASVKVVEYAGERIVPLEDFICGPGKTLIQRDEILTEVIIPDQPSDRKYLYKVRPAKIRCAGRGQCGGGGNGAGRCSCRCPYRHGGGCAGTPAGKRRGSSPQGPDRFPMPCWKRLPTPLPLNANR